MRRPAKHSIFINYRRDDAGGWPGRLEAHLVDRFGTQRVFRDVRIPAGADYADHIERVLDGCSVMLAVIGPGWTTLGAAEVLPSLHQPGDLLREELERALRRPDVTVIPVLVGGAVMPASSELPASLRALARRQATILTDQSWDHDVGNLVERVCTLLGEKSRRSGVRSRRGSVLVLATLAAAAIASGMFTLRDTLFPEQSGRAEASLVDYHRQVGRVCAQLGVGDRGVVAIGRRLRKRLRRARTVLAQRNALLDAARSTNARSAYELSVFKSIAIPPSQAGRHRATLALWNVNQDRVMAYQERLDGAEDAAGLVAAIRYLGSIRSDVVSDAVDMRGGLLRLGGASCVLKPPAALDTITLPKLRAAKAKARPRTRTHVGSPAPPPPVVTPVRPRASEAAGAPAPAPAQTTFRDVQSPRTLSPDQNIRPPRSDSLVEGGGLQ